MDATRMQYRDNSFDIAIDKGTYDALAVLLSFYDDLIVWERKWTHPQKPCE